MIITKIIKEKGEKKKKEKKKKVPKLVTKPNLYYSLKEQREI